VFPFPIEKEGKCQICDKAFSEHHYIDFFLDPKHVNAAREVLIPLVAFLEESMNACIKFASNTGPSDLSTKDIVEHLMELVKEDPMYADLFSKFIVHHVPSLKLEFHSRTIGIILLSNVKSKIMALTKKWENEFRTHKIGESSELYRLYRFGIHPEEKKNGDNKVERFYDITEEKGPWYTKFLRVHELDATDDYNFIQAQFYEVSALIQGFYKATQKLMKSEPYVDVQKAIKKRSERPLYVQSKDVSKLVKAARGP